MAIRLASGRDTADLVAQAAVEACSDEAQKEAKELPETSQTFDEVLAVVRSSLKSEALLAVMTVRAGHCTPDNTN